jgi:hypothetical protein
MDFVRAARFDAGRRAGTAMLDGIVAIRHQGLVQAAW